jgi:hypothetical protein
MHDAWCMMHDAWTMMHVRRCASLCRVAFSQASCIMHRASALKFGLRGNPCIHTAVYIQLYITAALDKCMEVLYRWHMKNTD